jgi:hypothetical protein
VLGGPPNNQLIYSAEQQDLSEPPVYDDDDNEIQEVEDDCEVIEEGVVYVGTGPGMNGGKSRKADSRPNYRTAAHSHNEVHSLPEPR